MEDSGEHPETIMRHARLFALLFLGMLCASEARADYPEKLIQIVVPFGAGSATNTVARLIAQHITERTKRPVLIDNRAGANSFLGVQSVARAAPDGYTVLGRSDDLTI